MININRFSSGMPQFSGSLIWSCFLLVALPFVCASICLLMLRFACSSVLKVFHFIRSSMHINVPTCIHPKNGYFISIVPLLSIPSLLQYPVWGMLSLGDGFLRWCFSFGDSSLFCCGETDM